MGFMPFGLLFDLFDGKVARWRGKSSLMGQELDSLADLASQCCILLEVFADTSPGVFRCRTRRPSLRYRIPEPPRSNDPNLLRSMRSDATSTLQRHSCYVAKGRVGKIEIF